MEKNVTKALLRDEYLEAYIKSLTIDCEAGSIMEIQLTLLVPDHTQAELADLVNRGMGRIAIIKI